MTAAECATILGAKQIGKRWMARCPAHDDMRASLSIGAGDNGRVLLKCFAGCGTDAVLAAAGLRMADLQPEPTDDCKPRIVATYDYTDEDDTPLYQVVRFSPKGFKQRRPDGSGGWIWNMAGVRRVLFGLRDMRQRLENPDYMRHHDLPDHVFVVEGEGDVDTLWRRGLIATTNVGGAGKWKDDYVTQLQAAGVKSVVVLPDNDEPGRQHAEAVALSCHAAGLIVKIVALPEVPAKGDVSDYLKIHTLSALLALVAAAPLYPPTPTERIVAPGTAVVDLSTTLDALVAFIRRYVVLSDDALTAIALWVAHAYVIDAAECTPYLVVSSATKRAGKTRLFEVLEQLVARPWFTGRVSAAALLRKIDAVKPTLLLDESDAAFKFDSEYTEAVRGLLNNGYRKGGRHSLCVGKGTALSARDFNTFCPKAFAGIGDVMPDTVIDRSIPIRLRRRTIGERVERFRLRKVPALAGPLREALAQWATAAMDGLSVAEPSLPDELNDRAQDVWEPLLAIADLAGEAWSIRSRSAAIALAGQQPDDNDTAVELLKDVRSIFADRPDDDAIGSTDLLAKLNALADRLWSTFSRGDRPLNGHGLARLLKPFGITSAGTMRFGTVTAKGYRRSGFDDAFARYLGCASSHRHKVNETAPEVENPNGHIRAERDWSKSQVASTNTALCDDVTVQVPDLGRVQDNDHTQTKPDEEWEQAW